MIIKCRVMKTPKSCILFVLDKDLHFSLEAGRYYEVEIKRNDETYTLRLVFVRFQGFWVHPDLCNNILNFEDGEEIEVDLKGRVHMLGEIG